MRRSYLILTLLWFFLTCWPVLAQEYITKQATNLIPARTPKLSTSGKDALSASVSEKRPDNSVELPTETRVRLVNRTRFMARQITYDRENSKSTSVNRLFKAALVEVLTGENKGSKGWVVMSYRDTGGDPQVFLAQAPAAPIE